MCNLSVKILPLDKNIMFKSQLAKPNHIDLRKHRGDTYGALVFSPDYGTTVLLTEMCTNHNDHSI
jgi:hypothetical protein